MNLLVFFIAVLVFLGIENTQAASEEVLKGVVGDSELAYQSKTVAQGDSLKIQLAPEAVVLRVREVYPDTPDQPHCTYDLTVEGRLLYRRDYIGTGFGPVSYFVYLPPWARKKTLVLTVNSKDPLRLLGVEPVDEKEFRDIEKNDTFGLSGLVSPRRNREDADDLLDELVANLPDKPGFYKAFSSEIPYASRSQKDVAELLDTVIGWAKENNLALLLSPVSWWAGTPGRVEDGEGGKFGDVKYHQICYTPDNTHEENPELKALLGSRWDPHYCLSVPNQWSNCPWLTMNSQKLNDYRHKRLDQAVKMIAERIESSGVELKGLYVENEPRYWDDACEGPNPKRDLGTLWADFNPFTVADAAKDGVTLDPSDGLDDKERLWLVRNVARYNQKAIDCVNKALKDSKLSSTPDVYTHSLQLVGFPGDTINHPMSEFAYVKDAYTGIEVMWSKLSDFDRVREWGPWANVNREEGDGRDVNEHLWDLRVTYVRGGKFYNSYNWRVLGPGVFFNYVREFMENLPTAEVKDPQVQQMSPSIISFATTPSVRGVNRIRAKINLPAPLPHAVLAFVKNPKGRIIGFSRVEGPFKAGEKEVDFVFSEAFELSAKERGTLEIMSEKEQSPALELKGATFLFDLRRERNKSLYVIEKAKRQ